MTLERTQYSKIYSSLENERDTTIALIDIQNYCFILTASVVTRLSKQLIFLDILELCRSTDNYVSSSIVQT